MTPRPGDVVQGCGISMGRQSATTHNDAGRTSRTLLPGRPRVPGSSGELGGRVADRVTRRSRSIPRGHGPGCPRRTASPGLDTPAGRLVVRARRVRAPNAMITNRSRAWTFAGDRGGRRPRDLASVRSGAQPILVRLSAPGLCRSFLGGAPATLGRALARTQVRSATLAHALPGRGKARPGNGAPSWPTSGRPGQPGDRPEPRATISYGIVGPRPMGSSPGRRPSAGEACAAGQSSSRGTTRNGSPPRGHARQ